MAARNRLHNKLKTMAASQLLPTGPQRGRADMPSIEKFIKDGLDPVHAIYAFVQHITSFFAENVSALPEMKAYATILSKAEDEYMPSAPPMSPLTASFFTTWALYDLRFEGTDTIGTCMIEANDLVCLNPDQLDVSKKLSASRMGVYEHVGFVGNHVRLHELITDVEHTCHVAAGYRGEPGQLWYVRLLPPLLPDLARYWIAVTTPYVLTEASKADWTQFLRRGSQAGLGNAAEGLHNFLKYGPGLNYWNEFVFKGYHHHQADAISLAGIPDLKATLPHA